MFEPLHELAGDDPHGVVLEPRVLGEKAGRLFGQSEQEDYCARGGAVYPVVQFANSSVVAWRSHNHRDGTGADDDDDDGSTSDDDKVVHRVRKLGASLHRASHTYTTTTSRRGLIVTLDDALHVPQKTLHLALRFLAGVLPAVRMLCPTAVPSYQSQCPQHAFLLRRRGNTSPERVCAIASHPTRLWLAVAVDEGGDDAEGRVVVYDAGRSRPVCVLRHAFQKSALALAWKPRARAVLAVGCRGGVLLWSLTERDSGCEASGEWRSDEDRCEARTKTLLTAVAWALFYPCARSVRVTSLGFSCRNGRYVACGSLDTTQLFVLDVALPPTHPAHLVSRASPSLDGATAAVLFAEDDTFVLSAVSRHPSLALTRLGEGDYGSVIVGLPAPVQQLARATGLGTHYFFVLTERLEGVMLARIHPSSGVELVRVVSTRLCRGVGGAVRGVACSAQRLWLALETGHLLVCHYGRCAGGPVCIRPVGLAEMEVTQLASFDTFPRGSLLAVVERAAEVVFLPSYHS